jgi:DNA polymerase-1
MKLLENEMPEAMVACWDTEAATFRHEAYKEYKAHREEQPDELYAQIPLIQQGLATLGVDSLELDGYEADDLLGTIAVRAQAEGWEVVIVTGDKDAFQLIRPGISVMTFKKGVSDTLTYDEAELKARFGLTPAQFLEYKAMRGDPSDNIPGVKGIGEKGATDLLQRFGNMEGILRAAHPAGQMNLPWAVDWLYG